ncbi:MAG: DUF3667 domain-containing protein [Flavobacteriales bacterium]|nr:DUF3667 domain-containing protein [Flavobacteriales bacterium]
MDPCKNCGASLSGAFCANCGQKADTRRIGWHWLVHEIQHSVFHVDKGVFFTLKELFVRPGRMLGEYLEGQRKRHFPPLSLVLVLAAIYSLLFHYFKIDLTDAKLTGKELQDMENGMRVVGERYALFELGSLPIFSFCSWLLLRRYGHNFTEHLVMNAYLSGQRIVFNIALMPFNLLGLGPALIATTLLSLLWLVYYVFAFAQLYEKKGSAMVTIGSLVAFILFWVLMLIFLVVVIIWNVNGTAVH